MTQDVGCDRIGSFAFFPRKHDRNRSFRSRGRRLETMTYQAGRKADENTPEEKQGDYINSYNNASGRGMRKKPGDVIRSAAGAGNGRDSGGAGCAGVSGSDRQMRSA